jgi:hypothetical protein
MLDTGLPPDIALEFRYGVAVFKNGLLSLDGIPRRLGREAEKRMLLLPKPLW